MSALVLIGPMGSGKTSIGRRVAKSLGVPFVDTDALVAREHGPIEKIFTELGEPRFRELERATVAVALASDGVIALGGGAVTDAGTRALLGGHRVVLLTVEPRTVAGRVAGSNRPLLAGEDPVARWQEIYAARRPIYEELADATFDTSRGPLSAVVDAVAAWARGQQGDEAEPMNEEGRSA
jgi:shikimate kinase